MLPESDTAPVRFPTFAADFDISHEKRNGFDIIVQNNLIDARLSYNRLIFFVGHQVI